ncbi:MAG: hypothetical protein DMD36_18180, partial [Gemmatimonadetes bacterium]
NYTITNKGAAFTITQAPLTIAVHPKSKQYSDPLPAFTGSITGIKNGDNLTLSFSTTATLLSNVGSYPISFGITDPNGKLGNYSWDATIKNTLTVTQEDARTTWSGLLFYSTASTSTSTANVTLQATIQDITAVASDPAYDPYPGDIRTSVVQFVSRDPSNYGALLCQATLTLLNPSDSKTAIASCSWTASIGNADAVPYTIGTVIAGNYLRDNQTDDMVLTVAKPLIGFTTGGGFLVNQASGGSYAGDAGLKTNFGFNAKVNKSGSNLQGSVNIIIRKGGRVYQIKSNAISSLTEQLATSGTGGTAQFASKANLTDITNPLAPISLGGNLNFQMTINDQGEPGTSDLVTFQLMSADGTTLLFSSNWSGTKTVEQVLGGGNVQVR